MPAPVVDDTIEAYTCFAPCNQETGKFVITQTGVVPFGVTVKENEAVVSVKGNVGPSVGPFPPCGFIVVVRYNVTVNAFVAEPVNAGYALVVAGYIQFGVCDTASGQLVTKY